MINFSKEEIEYIKEEFKNTKEEIDNCSKEELLELISNIGGDTIDTILLLEKHKDLWDIINTSKNINKHILDGIYWIGGMWVWVDAYMDTAEEVAEYINIEEYCSIFEKMMNEDNDDELVVNGTKFYYDPNELEITEDILDRLRNFPAEDPAYSVYLDETQGLVIY